MGVILEERSRVACLLNYQEGAFPFKYLGFLMSDKKLTSSDLEPLLAIVRKRTKPWHAHYMSSASRLVFTDACLSSLLLCTMGLFLLEDGNMLVLISTEGDSSEKAHAVNINTIGLATKGLPAQGPGYSWYY
jgi:hypothetical protein